VRSIQHVFYHVGIKIRLLFSRPAAWRQPSLKLEWVLTTANAAGTNGLTWLPKHGGARDNKFLGTHPMTDYRERCLASAHAERTDRGAIELLNT
jgi:hypothetical protein